jgi:hypothetical protein
MNASSRSALLNELLRPVPRPRVVIPPGTTTATATPWGMALPTRLIPTSIRHNHDFVRQLLDNFCKFCEQNHDCGDDPDDLACIRSSKRACGNVRIESEAQTEDFLCTFIFRFVKQALIDLEQNRLIDYVPQSYEPAIGTRTSYIWEDDRGARVVWQSKSPFTGEQFFSAMDRMAQKRTEFEVNLEELTFYSAESIIVKVRCFFFLNRRYRLTGFLRPR